MFLNYKLNNIDPLPTPHRTRPPPSRAPTPPPPPAASSTKPPRLEMEKRRLAFSQSCSQNRRGCGESHTPPGSLPLEPVECRSFRSDFGSSFLLPPADSWRCRIMADRHTSPGRAPVACVEQLFEKDKVTRTWKIISSFEEAPTLLCRCANTFKKRVHIPTVLSAKPRKVSAPS